MGQPMSKPTNRSKARLMLGTCYFSIRRVLFWGRMRHIFALKKSNDSLPFVYSSHHTPLLRELKNTEMWMQYNKIANLRLAAARVNGILLHPGEVFSYWRLIGKPSRLKGYQKGMILVNGTVRPGVGGGLCQLSNLIFWMTLHTPLTVVERHRHAYDVFPDSNRTQPFGSGATCFYPYGDLMIRNDTQETYQLQIHVGEKDLIGEWRVSEAPEYRYEVVERNHEMCGEAWGGFTRHNELYQQQYDLSDGTLLSERLIVKNDAIMMYSPFLDQGKE